VFKTKDKQDKLQPLSMSNIIRFSLFFISLTLQFNTCIAQLNSDTTLVDKVGFKSLFATEKYNPQKPYLSQLSLKAVPFVQEYIRKQGKELEKMKSWGRPYFDVYDNILPRYCVPTELKYLSVIESHLQSGLRSWAGAVGPWQLMDYEAKRFGLRVGNGIDERTDYYKSTEAAAKLLRELYNEFGDWLLVVAAYNGGAGRVKKAIRLSGSHDFWDLQYYLKEETRTHVKKFIGTHFIFEGGGGETTMTTAEFKDFKANTIRTDKALLNDTSLIIIPVSSRYSAKVVAEGLTMNLSEFNKLNAGFDKAMANGDNYSLRLPKDKAVLFQTKRKELLQESINRLLEGL